MNYENVKYYIYTYILLARLYMDNGLNTFYNETNQSNFIEILY